MSRSRKMLTFDALMMGEHMIDSYPSFDLGEVLIACLMDSGEYWGDGEALTPLQIAAIQEEFGVRCGDPVKMN